MCCPPPPNWTTPSPYGNNSIPVSHTSPGPISKVWPLFHSAWKFIILCNTNVYQSSSLCWYWSLISWITMLCTLCLCEISSSLELIRSMMKEVISGASQLPMGLPADATKGTTGRLNGSPGGGVVWMDQWLNGGRRGLSRTVGEGVGQINGSTGGGGGWMD